jgi:hypothetical protein
MESTRPAVDERRLELRSWIFVWCLALFFLFYGLFMYFVVGDKGPPDWDFGVVEDTPGKSVYSTFPEPAGATREPAPQHVRGKPALAPAEQGEVKK